MGLALKGLAKKCMWCPLSLPPTLFMQGALVIALTLLFCFGRHQPQEASYVLYMSSSFIRYHYRHVLTVN